MPNPFAIAAAGAGLFQAYGNIKAGKDAEEAMREQERMAWRGAKNAERKASIDEKNLRRMLSRTLGTGKAVSGASGIGGADATNTDLIDQIRQEGEMDAAMIRLGGASKAIAMVEGGEAARAEGESYRKAGYMNAASSLLSTGASMYKFGGSSWFKKSDGPVVKG